MAPRKGKNQAKRNKIKIKSKRNPQKSGLKTGKSRKLKENPVDKLKRPNKVAAEADIQRMDTGADWLNSNPYKKDFASSTSSEANSSGYVDYSQKEPCKSCFSDCSEECNCHDKLSENKYGILKRKSSSTKRILAKYIKSGMDHVAAFIVESAIRFGEQHGVVVPDKNFPNVYEITRPDDKRCEDKCRRIRFKIPERAKKLIWRKRARNPVCCRKGPIPLPSESDSLEEIIPLLEKLKKHSEANFKRLSRSTLKGERERLRNKEKSRVKEMEMVWDRERLKNPKKERRRQWNRAKQRAKEKIKKKVRMLARIKNKGQSLRRAKFRKDSLELGRQRLRTSICPRNSQSFVN